MRPIDTAAVHCTATKEGLDYTVATIRSWHLQRGFADIGYHFVVHLDGTISIGRPISKIGAHVAGHNTGSIGIVYVGGLDKNGKPKDTRTPAQKAAIRKLLKELVSKYGIKIIKGHRDFPGVAKACPCFDAIPEYRDLVGG